VPREPRIGEPLPRADEAIIPRAKLADYALDPNNPKGGHKATVFKRTLAIEQDDWEYLRHAILAALPDHRVVSVRRAERPDGVTTFAVVVPICGLNGRTLPVLTAWKLVGGRPLLTSARVAKGRSRRSSKGSTL
jgi:hypothetical protein